LATALTTQVNQIVGFVIVLIWAGLTVFGITKFLGEGKNKPIGDLLWLTVPFYLFTGIMLLLTFFFPEMDPQPGAIVVTCAATLPAFALSIFLYVTYFTPSLVFDLYVATTALAVGIYRAVTVNDANASFGTFFEWFMFIRSIFDFGLIGLLLWKKWLPESHTDWAANIASIVFFSVIHSILELPAGVNKNAWWAWALYLVFLLCLAFIGILTSERSPLVMAGFGILVITFKVSSEVKVLMDAWFNTPIISTVSQFSIMAAMGVFLIIFAALYNKKREGIESWVRTNILCQTPEQEEEVPLSPAAHE